MQMLQIVIQIKRKQFKLILFSGSWQRDVQTDRLTDRWTDRLRDRDTFVSFVVFQLNFVCYWGNFQSLTHLALTPASCAAIGCSIYGIAAISSQWQWGRYTQRDRQTTWLARLSVVSISSSGRHQCCLRSCLPACQSARLPARLSASLSG